MKRTLKEIEADNINLAYQVSQLKQENLILQRQASVSAALHDDLKGQLLRLNNLARGVDAAATEAVCMIDGTTR
jgi:hypothetical protein